MDEPGVQVENIFKKVSEQVSKETGGLQVPWFEGVIHGHFYFRAPPQATGTETEASLWLAMQRCGTSACLHAYLDAYPAGRFTAAARALLESQTATPAAIPTVLPSPPDPAAVEQALELNRAQRASIQAALNTLGHEVGATDGIWGRNTRTGISAWQRATDRKVTGYLSGEEYKLLLAQAESRLVAEHVKTPPVPIEATSPAPETAPRTGDTPAMVQIPEGCFEMGSPFSEQGRFDSEQQHRVCVKSFKLARYEVTNREFRGFRAGHDSKNYEGQSLSGDDQPVVYVSWQDAQAYAKAFQTDRPALSVADGGGVGIRRTGGNSYSTFLGRGSGSGMRVCQRPRQDVQAGQQVLLLGSIMTATMARR